MLFASNDRYTYARSPLIETICQLRFPPILSIEEGRPEQFLKAIGSDFPRYVSKTEQGPMILKNGKVEPVGSTSNHNLVSEDGLWKINLTRDFVALSTLRYTNWEEFAQRLDKVLAEFIQIYRPAFFERIGLRYLNAVSRERMGLEGELWDDLINAPFIGILSEPDVDEGHTSRCSMDVEIYLGEHRHMKLHAGPGMLGDGKQDPEPKFILDGDFATIDKEIAAQCITGELESLHDYAVRMFNAAITKELHEAMGPTPK